MWLSLETTRTCASRMYSFLHPHSQLVCGQWQGSEIQRITTRVTHAAVNFPDKRTKKNMLPWQRLTEITVGLLWENRACVLSKYWRQSWWWTLTAFSCLQLIKASEQRQRTFYHLSLEVWRRTIRAHKQLMFNAEQQSAAILYFSSQNSFSLLFKSLVFCT